MYYAAFIETVAKSSGNPAANAASFSPDVDAYIHIIYILSYLLS